MQLHEMNGKHMQSLNVDSQSQTSNEYFRLTNVIVFQTFRTEYEISHFIMYKILILGLTVSL